MFCENCGSKLPENAAFCENCGSPVQSEPQPQPTDAALPPLNGNIIGAPTMMPEANEGTVCEKCGNSVSAGAVFCPACGNVFGKGDDGPYSPFGADTADSSAPDVTAAYGKTQTAMAPPPPASPDAVRMKEIIVHQPEVEKAKKSSGLTVVCSVLFGILILASALLATVSYAFSDIVSNHKISNEVSGIEVSELIIGNLITDNEDVYEFFEEQDLNVDGISEDSTVEEVVMAIAHETDLKEDDAAKLIDKIDLSGYISRIVQSYEDRISGEDSKSPLSVDEIKKYIKKCEPSIVKYTGYKISDEGWDRIDEMLDEHRKDIRSISPDTLFDSTGKILSFAASPVIAYIAIAVTALLILILALITRNFSAAFMTGGIMSMIAGAVTAVGVFVLTASLPNVLKGAHSSVRRMITEIVNTSVAYPFYICAAVAFGAGIVLIILSAIIRALRKS